MCISQAKAQDKNSPTTKSEPVVLTPDNVVKVKGLKGEEVRSTTTGKDDGVDSKLSKPKTCKHGFKVEQAVPEQKAAKTGQTPPAIGVEGDPAFWDKKGSVTKEDVKKMPVRKTVPVANYKPEKK